MADVSVKIKADAKDAISELTKLEGETNKLKISLSKIVSTKDFSAVQVYLQQQEKAFKAIDTSGQAAAQTLALYQRALKSMLSVGGYSTDSIDTIRKKIEELQGVVDSQNKKSWGSKIAELTTNILSFQLVLRGMSAAFHGSIRLIKESAEAAAKAEQVYNKLDTVFAGMTTHMTTAYELAGKLGTALSTSASSLSTVGDLLQAQGMGTGESLQLASQWVSQFQDIINFKDINMTLEEFSQNFMSGAAGNLRNFRTFGSIVRESAVNAELAAKGLDKLTGGQLELEKMTIRANMALEQQANAIGATSREWDTMESVTRRYDEAVKGFKENLGEVVNEYLKPYREIITKWLDQFNKGNNANYERKQGSLDIHAYNLNNESDLKNFKQHFGYMLKAYNRSGDEINQEIGIKNLENIFIKFGATVELVDENFKNIPPKVREALKAIEEVRQTEVNSAKKSEAILASNSKYITRINSLFDALGAITNVTLDTSRIDSLIGANGGVEILPEMIAPMVYETVLQGFNSLNTTDAKEFVDFMTVVFGDAAEDGIKEKISSLKSYYSAVTNAGIADGTVSKDYLFYGATANTKEEKLLDDIAKSIKQLVKLEEDTKRIAEINEKYQAAMNPQKDIFEAISKNVNSESANIEKQRQADIDAIMAKYALDIAKAQEGIGRGDANSSMWQHILNATYQQRQYDIDTVTGRYAKQQALIEPVNQDQQKAVTTVTAYMSRFLESITDKKAIKAIMDESNVTEEMAQITLESQKAAKMLGELAESAGLTNYEYEENQKILDEYYENLKKQQTASESLGANILSSLGLSDIQNGILALQQTSAENGSQIKGLVSLIIAILQRLEIWDDLMDAVDYVFDVVNEVLQPISIMIKTLNSLAESIFDVLEPVMKALKPVAIAIITISGIVKVIGDVTMAILYATTFQFGKAREQLAQISEDIQAAADGVAEVANATWNVADNTEQKDEASYYQKLFQAGVINSNEYSSLLNGIHGVHWDSPTTTSLGSYVRGNGGITYYGDTTITINADHYTESQLVAVVQEAFQRSQQPGSLVYA